MRAELLNIARAEVLRLTVLAGEDPAEYRRVVGGALETMLFAQRSLSAEPEANRRSVAPGPVGWGSAPAPDRGGHVDVVAPGRLPPPGHGRGLERRARRGRPAPLRAVPANRPPQRGRCLYTWGYNLSHLAQRVHDLRTALAGVPSDGPPALLGQGDQAIAALLAAALDPGAVSRVAIDFAVGFDRIEAHDHSDFLPGAERWGGLAGYAALIAPTPLTLLGVDEVPAVVRRAYAAAGAPEAVRASLRPDPYSLTAWLRGTSR